MYRKLATVLRLVVKSAPMCPTMFVMENIERVSIATDHSSSDSKR